ncbi:PREDICTED: pre-mRNA-splicing factor CWC25 homolog isoform X2 [Priapulus caudatus]|nr:PREDICTED: pre-mRNA-splicing factor CWC25 homolog isoform X2 [Priapulus caudatus]
MQENLGWMYNKPTVERDEYLMGRKVDRAFEQLEGQHQEESILDKPGAKFGHNHGSSTIDSESKIREDPLLAIRMKEEEKKREIFNNPVKMKQLQKMAEERQKSKKNKKGKKHKKHGLSDEEDIDAKLITLLKMKKKLKASLAISSGSDSDNQESRHKTRTDPQLDTERRYKDHSSKRRHRHDSSSESDSSSEHPRKERSAAIVRHRQKRSERRERRDCGSKSEHSHRSVSRERLLEHQTSCKDPTKEDENTKMRHTLVDKHGQKHLLLEDGIREREEYSIRNSKKRQHSHAKDADKRHRHSSDDEVKRKDCSSEEKKKRRHKSSKKEARRKRHSSEGDDRKSQYKEEYPATVNHPTNTEEEVDSSRKIQDMYREQEEEGGDKRVAYGLIVRNAKDKDGSTSKSNSPRLRAKSKTPPKIEEKYIKPKPKRKLTEKELEEKMLEMMDNAKWREEQRRRKVDEYSKDESKEEADHGKHGAKFIAPMVAQAAGKGSVEDRIKRNIYKVQRSSAAHHQHFLKK